MKTLKDILSFNYIKIIGDNNINVTEIAFDSRQVTKGSMFIAISGTQVDGHKYIAKSIELGASSVVCEILPEIINPNIS